MIRKLILPALAALMLAGCASYQYRGGSGGDYYYGQPTTEYRYYGTPYGSYGYGYPSGWGGSIGYGYGYYPNYYRHYRYPRYPHRPHRPPHNGHGNGNDPTPGQPPTTGGSDRRPPWRDLGELGDAVQAEKRRRPVARNRPAVAPVQRSAPIRYSAPTIRTAPRQPRSKRDRDLIPTP